MAALSSSDDMVVELSLVTVNLFWCLDAAGVTVAIGPNSCSVSCTSTSISTASRLGVRV
jgi:hypothetical protein